MTTATAITLDHAPIARAAALLDGAKDYVIDSDFMLEAAGEDLKAVKGLAKQIEADRKALTKPLDEQKKTIMDFYRPAETYLVQAESILKKGIARYTDEQERIKRQAQIEAARATDNARAQLTREATAAAAAGNHNHAAGLELAAAITTVAVAEAPAAKIAGISSRKTYKGEVTNELALIQHILANPALAAMGIVKVDQAALNKYIQSTKGAVELPGVLIQADTTIASRAA